MRLLKSLKKRNSFTQIDYEDFKKENPEFSLQFAENPIALTRRAVCLELFPLRLALDNTIWLFVQNNYSKRDWLEIVIHEVNHIVNSVNNSLRVRGFDVIGRTGCALFSNKYAAKNGDIFEESINVLQTAEVMNHILGFYNFNIYDDEIRSIFDKYRDESLLKVQVLAIIYLFHILGSYIIFLDLEKYYLMSE